MKKVLMLCVASAMLTLAGCGDKSNSTSASTSPVTRDLTCADIPKVTDQKELADLKARCGLGSQTFKNSGDASWSLDKAGPASASAAKGK